MSRASAPPPIHRHEWLLALAGAILLAGCAWFLARYGLPRQETTIQATACRVPVTILGSRESQAAAVVFHGLSANRHIMLQLGERLASMEMAVYLLDLPGHGDNSEPYSYDRAEQCAASVVESLTSSGAIRPDRTVLVGHSMGATIAIRLADWFPTAATIAISSAMRMPSLPATGGANLRRVPYPRRMPVNLLLFSGEYDLPAVKDASVELVEAAGGERYAPGDFLEKRAVRWVQIPSATHTSLIFDRRVLRASANWIEDALPERVIPPRRGPLLLLGATVLGFAGLMLIFPLAASGVASTFGSKSAPAARGTVRGWAAWLAWAAVGLVAVGVQYRFVTLGPVVHMYSGDYLASVLMIAGVALLMTRKRWAPQVAPLRGGIGAVGAAVLLGLGTMLAFGAWMNWQLTDAWLNAARWVRFGVLVPLLLPYFVAEEMALGPPAGSWSFGASLVRRYGLFLGLRGTLWLAILAGNLVLHSGEVLLLLLVIYLTAFSLGQRLGMDAVRRRTGSAAAAAVFGAILGAWFIAAVFPLTP